MAQVRADLEKANARMLLGIRPCAHAGAVEESAGRARNAAFAQTGKRPLIPRGGPRAQGQLLPPCRPAPRPLRRPTNESNAPRELWLPQGVAGEETPHPPRWTVPQFCARPTSQEGESWWAHRFISAALGHSCENDAIPPIPTG